jgi:hypothetical protein
MMKSGKEQERKRGVIKGEGTRRANPEVQKPQTHSSSASPERP